MKKHKERVRDLKINKLLDSLNDKMSKMIDKYEEYNKKKKTE